MARPILFPVRLELRAGQHGPACAFTVDLPFMVPPAVGHNLIFNIERQIDCTVLNFYHFMPCVDEEDVVCLVRASPIVLDDYDAMLMVLDWFKAHYEISDIQATDRPESYYAFYRSVVHLLGRAQETPVLVTYEPNSIKVVAEACRVVLVAEICQTRSVNDDEIVQLIGCCNHLIEDLHKSIISRRQEEPAGADLLGIIRRWEPSINPEKRLCWVATLEQCLVVARTVFGKLHSVPNDSLPPLLRQGDNK